VIQEKLCATETWETVEFGSIGNTFSCFDEKECEVAGIPPFGSPGSLGFAGAPICASLGFARFD